MYVGWGCILNCFYAINPTYLVSLLFADLLSLHIITFFDAEAVRVMLNSDEGVVGLQNLFVFQVVTALLVAGSTLTYWIPPFASTSSYSSVVQSTRLARIIVGG